MKVNKNRIAAYLANSLDHFDSSLYGFLVPLIAPLLFNTKDKITSVVLGYGVFLLGIITRFLGSWYFSKIAQKKGPNYSLIRTIQGITITTFCFAFIQPYEKWEIFSAVSLCFLKSLQNFFSSGEVTVASLYVLENSKPKERHPISSYFLTSTMVGIGLAGIASTIVFYMPNPEKYWKVPFYFSVLTALTSWFLRKNNINNSNLEYANKKLEFDWKLIIKIIPIMALYYVTYSVPMVFFNSFAVFLTKCSMADLMASNTMLMIFDVLTMLLLGKVLKNIDSLKIIKISTYICGFSMPVLFIFIPNASLQFLIAIRIFMIVVGVSFSIPLYKFLFEKLPKDSRYFSSAIGYALGSEIFGRSFPAIGLFLWQYTELVIAPALYVSLICIFTLISLKKL